MSFAIPRKNIMPRRFLIAGTIIFCILTASKNTLANSVVVFNEIMYHPATNEAGLEYVELHNQMARDVDLSNWSLTGEINYTFPQGTLINAHGFIVVAADPVQLVSETACTNTLGPFTGRLANSSGTIRLRHNGGRVMDEISYKDSGDWPDAPDGFGPALVKIDQDTSTAFAENWTWSTAAGTPGQTNNPFIPSATTSLAFNELPAAASNFWIELVNYGSSPMNLIGHVVTCTGTSTGRYVFPSQVIATGAYVVVDEATLGFYAGYEDRLALYAPGETLVLDVALMKFTHRGRIPEGTGRWLYPNTETPGSSNTFTFRHEIVINEIMYNQRPQYDPYVESEEEWIELYNKSTNAVDLSGWSFSEGISFEFETGTIIAPSNYLVLAWDTNAMITLYPALSNSITGPFSGRLANGGELLVLEDNIGNLADEVRYFDGGRWPEFADGGGSSMELRDPDADNAIAEAWAASDESARATWNAYSYRDTAVDDGIGNDMWHEFVMGLLSEGEVLIDDVSVIKDPDGAAVELIQNGTFESDAVGSNPDKWRLIGTHGAHGRSRVVVDPDDGGNKALHMVVTGPMGHMHNHAETTFVGGAGNAVTAGTEYEISFRAKTLAGSRQLNTRLYFNWVQATTLLDVSYTNGTPGTENSRRESNIGPTYTGFTHGPVLPAIGGPVTVSVVASDPEGVAGMTNWYAVNGGGWNAVTMTPQGNGLYTATIPGQGSGAIVQFYVEGHDALGASSTFPARGPDSRALYAVEDGQGDLSKLHNLRIIMTAADRTLLYESWNRMSNDRIGCTIVYDEKTVFYDTGIRLKGSAWGRYSGGSTGLNLEFHPDRLFRGVHRTIAVERGGMANEVMAKHLLDVAAGGLTHFFDDVTRIIMPNSADTGVQLISMARYGDVFFESQYKNGGDVNLYNLELLYTPNTTVDGDPESLKKNNPYNHTRGQFEIMDLGDTKESYRWNMHLRNNYERDDYTLMMDVAKAFELTGDELDQRTREVMDLDQWMRTWAMMSLNGNGDVYTRSWDHNFRMCQRPEDNKMLAMTWDLDRAFELSTSSALWGGKKLQNIIELTANRRLYYGHLWDMIKTVYNSDYMAYWSDHYTERSGISCAAKLTYIGARSAYVLTQLPTNQTLFSVTNANMSVNEEFAVIGGEGRIDVHTIRVAGRSTDLETTWTNTGTDLTQAFFWQAPVPLEPGTNDLVICAYDFRGNLVASNNITIVSLLATRALRDNLRITELMYNPVEGSDYEFIELCNTGTNTLDISKVVISDGVDFAFTSSPITNLAEGAYIVVVGDLAAFSSKYNTNGMNIAGQYTGSLNNGGEHIAIQGQWYSRILDFTYSDGRGWPLAADGAGHSLVPLDFENQDMDSLYYGGHWRASTFIDGSPGEADPSVITNIMLNEIIAHTDTNAPPYDSNDRIELYNAASSNITLTSNWYLSDDASDLKKWAFSGTVISNNSFLDLDEMNDFHNPITTGFGLNKAGEQVFLSFLPGPDEDRVVDCVQFKGEENGYSLGRYPDGETYWYALAPSSGMTNNAPEEHAVINEIMYHPAPRLIYPEDNTADEYVEIYNPAATPLQLWNETGTWRIDGGIDFEFPVNTIIPARDYLVVVSFDPVLEPLKLTNFLNLYKLTNGETQVLGPYNGNLSNRGERLALERPQAPDLPADTAISWVIVDEVIYFDKTPWIEEPDGTGPPLQRNQVTISGNNPTNWYASLTATPGKRSERITITHPIRDTQYIVPISDNITAIIDTNLLEGTAEVEFFANTNSLGTDTNTPFSCNMAGITEANYHSLTAVLTDDSGTYTSLPVDVLVLGTLTENWPYRMKIVFSGYTGSETLKDFPALVLFNTNMTDFSYTEVVRENAGDLRFADSDGITVIQHEIENWNTNGKSTVWVRVPELSGTNDFIWAYWGNTQAITSAESTNGATWGANYRTVWHFHDDFEDSTSNKTTAVNHDSGSITSMIANGRALNGTNQYIETGVPTSWYGDNINNMTISMWVWTHPAGNYASYAGTPFGSDNGSGNALYMKRRTRDFWEYGAKSSANYTHKFYHGEWVFLNLVLTNGQAYAWKNNVVAGPFAYTGFTPPAKPLTGYMAGQTTNIYSFMGIVDEVRVSGTARSADWIKAEHKNVLSNSLFTSFEPPPPPPPAPPPDEDIDGMADTWEGIYFGGTNISNGGPAEDWDEDGFDNLSEYIAGTCPTSPESLFMLYICYTNGKLAVMFPALEPGTNHYGGYNRLYSLENNTNLELGAWTGIPDYTNIPGADQTVSYTNTAEPRVFFKAKVWLE